MNMNARSVSSGNAYGASILGLALAALCAMGLPATAAESSELDTLRTRALGDIFVLRDYRAGKNSFVESAERHIGAWGGVGYRHTLLDVQGEGSLRHIWTTRGDGDPPFDWEFYVDGETEPSIRGTDVELIAAAGVFAVPVAPNNYLPVNNRAFNFFLPVPFERSLRVDVVQRVPSFWLWFCQMDYRLDDDSLRGARLVSQGSGADMRLSYVGLPHQQLERALPSRPRETRPLAPVTLKPGQQATLARLSGPAIVRELRLQWPAESSLRLRVRYDDADSFAVDSPVGRLFGPFRGVSYFHHAPGDASCYLPMPFRKTYELVLTNEGDAEAKVAGEILLEPVPSFSPSWGYFHALYHQTPRTTGHRPHQVLYARGRGHWLGMSLFNTGHDHGGGDFAVVDGEGEAPGYLHGVNGEDYFTFAWFGKGAHHPYAVAHTNEEGRYRHHFENVYPFSRSIAIEWGAFADLSPESVTVWYQDSPENTTLPDGARAESAEWDVFGPVAIPHDENGRTSVEPFSVLPSVADLDAGKEFECVLVKEKFTSGWQKEQTVGPMLNLTYIARHKAKVDPESELGGMGHAFLARRFVTSASAREVECLFAHDDPAEIWINGRRVYAEAKQLNGFETRTVRLPLREGRNEIVVRLTNYFNRTFNWTGFLLRPAAEPVWR